MAAPMTRILTAQFFHPNHNSRCSRMVRICHSLHTHSRRRIGVRQMKNLIEETSSQPSVFNTSHSKWALVGLGIVKEPTYTKIFTIQRTSFCTLYTHHEELGDRKCWKCNRQNGNEDELFFCDCGIIQRIPKSVNYFDILQIEQPTFNVDPEELSNRYIDFQRKLHPDRFVGRSEEEVALSVDLSALVNAAYKTLQKPLSRGLYLLQLRGNSIDEETQITDPEFLMEIMDINEKIADRMSAADAKRIWNENTAELEKLNLALSNAFDCGDFVEAKSILTRMKYFSNIEDKLKEYQREHGLEFS